MLGKKISLFVAIFSLFLVGITSIDSAHAMTIDELCDPNQPGAIVAGPGEKNIKGTNGDDIIIGNELDNKIDGKKGADVICGGDGDDDLRGGQQNDILLGQAGSDKFTGGQGIDTCDLSVEDTNEKNCELAFGGQDLGGDGFTDIIVDVFGNVDNFLNQFLKSDGTFNVDSFFDVFTEVSVHDFDVDNLQTQIDTISLTPGPQGDPGVDGIDGLACWDTNGNGIGEIPDEDTNGDGVVDVLDCIGSEGPQGIQGDPGMDTLGNLSCAENEVAKFVGGVWICEVDNAGGVIQQQCNVGQVIVGFDSPGNAICKSITLNLLLITSVDTADSVGDTNSIAIGNDGLPIISYRDGSNSDLKVAHCNDVSCTSATITSVDTVGSSNSIAIGNNGLPIISYHDFSNGDLKVAVLPGLTFN